jgi:hypothetical protein
VLNHIDRSVSVIDLSTHQVIDTVSSAPLPAPGSPEAEVLLGEELFNTARGPAAPGLTADGRDARFAMSDNGWGSCFNCHPFGLADGVTWIFPSGPRQTIPLDGTVEASGAQERILGWTAIRSSVQDFEKNTENVSGGFGLIDGNGAADGVVNHGANRGVSAEWDAIAKYVETIRTPPTPAPFDAPLAATGRDVFASENCADCHGGALWTRSRVTYTLPADADPDVTLVDGQIVSVGTNPILHDVGSFDPAGPIEIRGGGPQAGQAAQGAQGFNPPSLLGVGRSAPYFHDGRHATLEVVVQSGHGLAAPLLPLDERALVEFLRSIDDATPTFP